MKIKRKLVKGFVMTILLSLMITALFAQKPDNIDHPTRVSREFAPPPPPPPNAPCPPPPPMADIQDDSEPPQLDIPGLSNDQKDKIHQANLEHMKTMTPLRNQVREKKARLQTVLTTSPFDNKTADQVAEELGKTGITILKETIRHDQELRNLLTLKQQIVFDARPKPFLRRD